MSARKVYGHLREQGNANTIMAHDHGKYYHIHVSRAVDKAARLRLKKIWSKP